MSHIATEECQRHKLESGLKLLTVPSKNAPVVSIQAWVCFGAADEGESNAGLAHLFEHLLFKGTKKRGVGQIAADVEALGGDVNAYTSYDQTVLHLTLQKQFLEDGLEILSDALIHSIVDKEELEREKLVVLEEISRRNDQPGAEAFDLMHELRFPGHPYARPVIGYSDVVAKMNRDTIYKQYKKFYNRKNIFLVVAGDFEEKKVIDLADKYFADLPDGETPKQRSPVEIQTKITQKFIPHSYPNPLVHLSWLSPSAKEADVAALDVFCSIMGQGDSSRLSKKLLHQMDLCQGISAYNWSPKNLGRWGVSFKPYPGKTELSMKRILEEIRETFEKPIEEREVEKAKRSLLAENHYSKETVDGLAQRFAYFEAIGGDFHLDQVYSDNIQSLNIQDLNTVRDKWIDWDGTVACGIVPKDEKRPTFKAPKKAAQSKSKNKSKTNSLGVESFDYNGLKVLVRPLRHLPLFSLRWVQLGGMRLEPAKSAGVGRLWEACVGLGAIGSDSKVWRREDLSEFYDSQNASVAAFHGRNSHGYSAGGFSKDIDAIFDLLLAVKRQPIFEQSEFKKEKKQLLLDISAAKDSPTTQLSHLFRKSMYGKHSYGRPSTGEQQTIRGIQANDLLRYHKKIARTPEVLCVVGDVTVDEVYKLLEENVGKTKFSTSKALLQSKKLAPRKKEASVDLVMNKEQSHILRGYPTCPVKSKDRWGLLGLSAILSGQGGRLFLELRDRLSLCYTVSTTHQESIDGGHFAIYIGTSPEKELQAIEAMDRELQKICTERVQKDEWEKAKNYYSGNHVIEQQHLASQSLGMALNELYGLGFEEYLGFSNRIKEIKVEEIKSVARKYFGNPKKRVTAIVRPELENKDSGE